MRRVTFLLAQFIASIVAVHSQTGSSDHSFNTSDLGFEIGDEAHDFVHSTGVLKGIRPVAPTGFEENKGQMITTAGTPAPDVRFRLVQHNTSIFLLGKGIAYQFSRMHKPEGMDALEEEARRDATKQRELDVLREQTRLETYRMDMLLEGADPNALITTEGRSADHTNYYNHEVIDVRSYERITYHNVYPGIDWVLYTTDKGIKYDFVVHPGADPALIRLRFKDHEELYVDADGNLVHGNRMGRFTEDAPVSFQEGGEVKTRFVLVGNTVSFALDAYDPAKALTIDPARIWGTYYGGTGFDQGWSSAVDGNGNVYLAGQTNSATAIAIGGHQDIYGGGLRDAFLVKFNAAGTRQWATYYGGGGNDIGTSCVVDHNGNVFLAGYTASTTAIASEGHQNANGGGFFDAFLVKFDPAGFRQWATYYGGTGTDYGLSCAADGSGNVYLAGNTESTTAIASGGHQVTYGGGTDAFLVKFNAVGTRLWATYYGGAVVDEGRSCAVDGSGNVYLVGVTSSTTAIASGGHQNANGGGPDAFLVKFNATGNRLWATYYGEMGGDFGSSCAVDGSDNVYLAGYTGSTSAIASGGHQGTYGGGLRDAFLVKFNAVGTRLWATYYGGTVYDEGGSCTVDVSGSVYLAGFTSSTTAIASGGHQDTYGGGSYDAFLVKFDPSGFRQWATYYGGTGTDFGFYCAADGSGNVYLAGHTESTTAIASEGHQNTQGGGSFDAFLVRFLGSPDTDGDGVLDDVDNCPSNANAGQEDDDADGIGNACDACLSAWNDIPNFDTNTCACELGYYATTTDIGGSDVITACTICPPGSFCADGINAVPCPAGRYQDQPGQIACTDCAAGSYNATVGAISCQACDAGTFSAITGSTSCTACPEGTFSAVTGASVCTACPAGYANDLTGQTACGACPPGSFSANEGQAVCDLCPGGTYNAVAAQTECLSCPNGETSDVGATECTPLGMCTDYILEFQSGSTAPNAVTYEVLDETGTATILSGNNPVPANSIGTLTLCLPDGCYQLRVTDAAGDGLLGYVLRETGMNGRRLIDNRLNMSDGVSAIANGGTFCVPMGDDRPIFSSCDKLDWVNNKFIVCHANAAVTAEYGVSNTTSGYEFWFFDPNGTYSYRRFRSHATSDGYGSGATRACHFKVNGWFASMATPHIPADILLNVRVRGRVAGSNLPFGPACQFKIDAALAACPRVKLQDDPANTSDYSCGVSRNFGGSSSPANRIYANPPQPIPMVASNMVRYQFRFRITGEALCIVRPPQTSARMVLNWTNGTPLECSKTYEVDVRVSLDGGATWCFGPAGSSEAAACADTEEWGKVCNVTINPCSGVNGGTSALIEDTNASSGDNGQHEQSVVLHPNPNRGDQLYLRVSGLEAGVAMVNVDIYDLTGKRVMARTIAVNDGLVRTNLELNGDLGSGMYMVVITAGEVVHTERLVIQQ